MTAPRDASKVEGVTDRLGELGAESNLSNLDFWRRRLTAYTVCEVEGWQIERARELVAKYEALVEADEEWRRYRVTGTVEPR